MSGMCIILGSTLLFAVWRWHRCPETAPPTLMYKVSTETSFSSLRKVCLQRKQDLQQGTEVSWVDYSFQCPWFIHFSEDVNRIWLFEKLFDVHTFGRIAVLNMALACWWRHFTSISPASCCEERTFLAYGPYRPDIVLVYPTITSSMCFRVTN